MGKKHKEVIYFGEKDINWISNELFSKEELSQLGKSLKQGSDAIIAFAIPESNFVDVYVLEGDVVGTSKRFSFMFSPGVIYSASDFLKETEAENCENILIARSLKEGKRLFLPFSNDNGLRCLSEMMFSRKQEILHNAKKYERPLLYERRNQKNERFYRSKK